MTGPSSCRPGSTSSVLAYDDTVRNIDIGRVGYLRHSFIAGFPTERVPKMPSAPARATLPGSRSAPRLPSWGCEVLQHLRF